MSVAYVIAGTVLILAGIASETVKTILRQRDEASIAALRHQGDTVSLATATAAVHRAVMLAGDPDAGAEYLERVEALVLEELRTDTLPVETELDDRLDDRER